MLPDRRVAEDTPYMLGAAGGVICVMGTDRASLGSTAAKARPTNQPRNHHGGYLHIAYDIFFRPHKATDMSDIEEDDDNRRSFQLLGVLDFLPFSFTCRLFRLKLAPFLLGKGGGGGIAASTWGLTWSWRIYVLQ